MTTPATLRKLASWTLYPFSWVILLAIYFLADHGLFALNIAPTILGASLILLYLGFERLIPYQQRWSMT